MTKRVYKGTRKLLSAMNAEELEKELWFLVRHYPTMRSKTAELLGKAGAVLRDMKGIRMRHGEEFVALHQELAYDLSRFLDYHPSLTDHTRELLVCVINEIAGELEQEGQQ